MTEQEQIRAIAELDGFEIAYGEACRIEPDKYGEPEIVSHQPIPPYLTSRDAIVPVIEKQFSAWTVDQVSRFRWCCFKEAGLNAEYYQGQHLPSPEWFKTTFALATKQLCKALLCATGKWKP